ncbi:tRNA (adenosine(37)-N6)-dimethylallyltransferase MiaA [Maribacter halichondriae]|uniref:tRNA (adenosine(37)-N6)-dimethylallyltransferase MiaA n=1 Tax=Maribacter halichondriae TaxID=2980554 RepID=UPI002359746B|nr:tRNA (adenosine(37)-N6)-dimethylallyltransferase MiaA [Maribacter sp. Hal144]
MLKTLISIVGPTAIGKTKLAIAIAKHFKTDIISSDSRQFYKEMKIGTAVPSEEELSIVPHHFIQHKSIFDKYSVGDFERDALVKLEALFENHDIVVMVGGSGLYIDAVTLGLDDFPEVDPKFRKELNLQLAESGITSLQKQLEALDPEYYIKVDHMNPHRLIRALEICLATGKPYSSFLNRPKQERPFKTITVQMTADRPLIYERINNRVDGMIRDGLLEEARELYAHRSLNALQTVGYTELFHYFDGSCDLEFAISEIKKNTRRFAKRQLTWFKKNDNALKVDLNDNILQVITETQKRIQKCKND